MGSCSRPLTEQTFVELADCALQQSRRIFARLFESYVHVVSDPGDALLLDWAIVLITFCGAAALIARAMVARMQG